jgi:hypothetical protein
VCTADGVKWDWTHSFIDPASTNAMDITPPKPIPPSLPPTLLHGNSPVKFKHELLVMAAGAKAEHRHKAEEIIAILKCHDFWISVKT